MKTIKELKKECEDSCKFKTLNESHGMMVYYNHSKLSAIADMREQHRCVYDRQCVP